MITHEENGEVTEEERIRWLLKKREWLVTEEENGMVKEEEVNGVVI